MVFEALLLKIGHVVVSNFVEVVFEHVRYVARFFCFRLFVVLVSETDSKTILKTFKI